MSPASTCACSCKGVPVEHVVLVCASLTRCNVCVRLMQGKMPFWFRAHVTTQRVGIVIAVAAFVIAIIMTPSGHHFGSTHSLLGLAVSIAGFVQPLIGLTRPSWTPIARTVGGGNGGNGCTHSVDIADCS